MIMAKINLNTLNGLIIINYMINGVTVIQDFH